MHLRISDREANSPPFYASKIHINPDKKDLSPKSSFWSFTKAIKMQGNILTHSCPRVFCFTAYRFKSTDLRFKSLSPQRDSSPPPPLGLPPHKSPLFVGIVRMKISHYLCGRQHQKRRCLWTDLRSLQPQEKMLNLSISLRDKGYASLRLS